MLQRAMIAMAIARNPRLLIADEPTTALDVTVQAQILRLLRGLQEELGMALILITHDLGIVAETAHEVLVLYAGKAVEQAPCRSMLGAPRHPYTQALLRARPNLADQGRLTPIPGQLPNPLAPPPGCPFQPRCPGAWERCALDPPPLAEASDDPCHLSACWPHSVEVAS